MSILRFHWSLVFVHKEGDMHDDVDIFNLKIDLIRFYILKVKI